MAVGKHLAAHRHRLPGNRLDRKLPPIEHRLGVLDGNARQQQRLGQGQMRIVVLGIIVQLRQLRW
ncbi:hypothetical protein D3C71_2070480 [compost metagenome]